METRDQPLAKTYTERAAKPKETVNSLAARKAAASRPTDGQAAETSGIAMAAPQQFSMSDHAISPAESADQMGLLAATADPAQAELQLRAFLSSQGLSAKPVDLPPPFLWTTNETQKAFVVRGIDHEQLQSLRRLLDGSATTTLNRLNAPAPATQSTSNPVAAPTTEPAGEAYLPATEPSYRAKVDLLILVRSTIPQPADEAPPRPMTEPATQPDLPTTSPTFEDYQMP
jgi:hypothetical protein